MSNLLRDEVITHIRKALASRSLEPGEWLRQDRLAAELGVSPIPVREAFKQLEVEGLLEHVPYRGVRVARFSAQDVEDLYTVRAFLESLAAESAAARITPQQMAELRQIAEELGSLTEKDSQMKKRELNRRFHLLIGEAAGRPYISRLLSAVLNCNPAILWTVLSTDDSPPADRERLDCDEHLAIVEALEAGDGALASQRLEQHVHSSRERLIRAMQWETESAA